MQITFDKLFLILKTLSVFLKKLNIELPYDPKTPFLGKYHK